MLGLSFPLLDKNGAVSLSDSPPDPENVNAWSGQKSQASRTDHVHQRLDSSHAGLILGSDSTLTVTYSRTFAVKPDVQLTTLQPVGSTTPAFLEIQSHTKVGSLFTGCVVRGYKGQTLPMTITVVTSLASFNVFGASAAGTEFNLLAQMPSL